MTPDQLTQAAAQRCADLANALHPGSGYDLSNFATAEVGIAAVFRREVEAKDAMIREVLALLGTIPTGFMPMGSADQLDAAKSILRANLLPDPKPTLLEEFKAAHPYTKHWPNSSHSAVEAALDWIAKRQENEG